MPAISIPASFVNIDFIGTDQVTQKTDALHEIPDNSVLKEHKSLPAQESRSNSYHFQVNQANNTDFLSRSDLSNNNPFKEEKQDGLGESNEVLEEIKISLKGINNEWNDVENWLNLLLEERGIYNPSNLATDEKDLLASTSHQREYLDAQIDNLTNLSDHQDSADIERQLDDQPLLYQLLFFLSIPHLIKLISANLTSLIIIVILWTFIHGLIKFVRWKMNKKKTRRTKKKRSIDGFTKY
jgi:hypothetical protein